MQKSHFNRLIKEGFNHIPLSREVVVDTLTPLALYLLRGTLDTQGLDKRRQRRSKYGAKRPK